MALAATVVCVFAPAPAAQAVPDFTGSFVSQRAAFDFAKPIGMAVAPDGRMFFTDDAGIVKTTATMNGRALPLFDLRDHVNLQQDRGLVGIAVDRNYLINRHIYLAYTFEDRTPAEILANGTLVDRPKTQRLVRVTVPLVMPDPANPIDLESEDTDGQAFNDETIILGRYSSDPSRPGVPFSSTQACPQPADLVNGNWSTANSTDCIPSDSKEHTIDSVRVDPVDGTLWVSVGDGGLGGASVDPRAWRSQRDESYAGKLLHVDPSGQGLEDHPFCPTETDLTKVCTKVHAKGFRNPFRFSLRPAPDYRPLVGDAGWETREELDLVEPGKNYGWPCREGKIPTPGWSARPECQALPSSTFTDPIYDYPQITDGAVIGGVTYEGKLGNDSSVEYPPEYKDAIFFSDYGNETVWYIRLNAAQDGVAPGYPKVFATGLLAVDWATAPNGELMYVDIGFGSSELAQVNKIAHDPDNGFPIAIATADKTFGDVPLDVQFNGSASNDPNGSFANLDFAWDLDGDGNKNDSNTPNPSFEYIDDEENVTVSLEVTDLDGNTSTATIDLYPGNHPPVPDITTGPTLYQNGQQIQLEGEADDPDAGDSVSLTWDVALDHAGTHVHPWSTNDGSSVSFVTDTAHDAPSTYIVTLNATDERGMRTQDTRVLTPITSLVKVLSTPPGAPITYAGVNLTAPFEKQSTIGLLASASAASSFTSSGRTYAFDGWADGGPLLRDLLVGPEGVTLTARYRDLTPAPSPSPQPPPTVPVPVPGPVDGAAPALAFSGKKGVNARRGRFNGSATDATGVTRIKLALRAAKKKKGKCLWWSRKDKRLSRTPAKCKRPAFMTAKLSRPGATKTAWSLALGTRLPKGSYVLVFRAADGAGNVGMGRKPVALAIKK